MACVRVRNGIVCFSEPIDPRWIDWAENFQNATFEEAVGYIEAYTEGLMEIDWVTSKEIVCSNHEMEEPGAFGLSLSASLVLSEGQTVTNLVSPRVLVKAKWAKLTVEMYGEQYWCCEYERGSK